MSKKYFIYRSDHIYVIEMRIETCRTYVSFRSIKSMIRYIKKYCDDLNKKNTEINLTLEEKRTLEDVLKRLENDS